MMTVYKALTTLETFCLSYLQKVNCPDNDYTTAVELCLDEVKTIKSQLHESIKNQAYDDGTLVDWYISSVDETQKPKWTRKMIGVIIDVFYLIPRDEVHQTVYSLNDLLSTFDRVSDRYDNDFAAAVNDIRNLLYRFDTSTEAACAEKAISRRVFIRQYSPAIREMKIPITHRHIDELIQDFYVIPKDRLQTA